MAARLTRSVLLISWHGVAFTGTNVLGGMGSCGICFVAKVCVAIVGLVESSFSCPWVGGLLL